MEFLVANPKIGKYAGRTVADVYVGNLRTNVADYMIKHGHAKPYDGGTKPDWKW